MKQKEFKKEAILHYQKAKEFFSKECESEYSERRCSDKIALLEKA